MFLSLSLIINPALTSPLQRAPPPENAKVKGCAGALDRMPCEAADRCQANHHGLGRLEKGDFARASRDRRSEYCHRCTTKSGAKRGRTRHVNLARTDFLLDRLLC
jgi:hypothetical protein